MNTTSDVRGYLRKQLEELAELAGMDLTKKANRDVVATKAEIAKATAIVTSQFVAIAKVEVDAARALGEYGITTDAVPLEGQRKQALPKGERPGTR